MSATATTSRNYEPWFLSQGVVGFINAGGAAFLVAPLIVSQGGSPADAGMFVGLLPFVALLSPLFGGIADRFLIHREMVLGGMAILCLASLVMFSAEQELSYIVGALLFGTGGGIVIIANLGMLTGGGLAEEDLSRRMGLLQMSLPLGQFAALGLSAALLAAGVPLQSLFLMHAVVAVLGIVVMWSPTKSPAQRVREHMLATKPLPGAGPSRIGLRAVVLSAFGLFLLVNFLSQFGEQLVESQYPNYLNDVFQIDPEAAALAMAVAVLISAPLYPVSGRWAAKAGPKRPFMVAIAVRGITVAGLAVLSLVGEGQLQVLAMLLFGLMIVVYPYFEVNTSLIAARTSPIGPGAGQGFQGAATQTAGILGGFAAGWLAGQLGYSSLAWFATGLSVLAFIAGLFLRVQPPARTAAAQPQDAAVARAAVAAMGSSGVVGGVLPQSPDRSGPPSAQEG